MDPFDNESLRDWFFKELDPPTEFTDTNQRLLVDGDGPFGCNEFIAFLNRAGMDAARLDDPDDMQADAILVVGSENTNADCIEWLIEERMGLGLRIYSQEMFLTYWAKGVDPFTLPSELVESFRENHIVLQSLPAARLDWPSTFVTGKSYDDELEDYEYFGTSPSRGLLSVAGYGTGTKHPDSARRRNALRKLFEAEDLSAFKIWEIDLTPRERTDYLRSFGRPNSCQRLKKIADSIAAFCRSRKRKGRPYDLAITHWEEDLEWLKTTYFGRCRSRDWWPTTEP